MKPNTAIKIKTGFGYLKVASIVLINLIGSAGRTEAQQYASQDGRILDANPRVGSFGLNNPTSLDALGARGNLYITGNVRGGKSFQGLVPYGSEYEGSAVLGSSTLNNFMRDSTGSEDLGRPVGSVQPYFNPLRQTTQSFGGNVLPSSQFFQRYNVTPTGSSLMLDSGRPAGTFRPLNQPYMAINAPPGESWPMYQRSRAAALDSSVSPVVPMASPQSLEQKNLLTPTASGLPKEETASAESNSTDARIRPEFAKPPQSGQGRESKVSAKGAESDALSSENYYQRLEPLSQRESESATGRDNTPDTGERTGVGLRSNERTEERLAPLPAGTAGQAATGGKVSVARSETVDQFSRRQFDACMQKGQRYMQEKKYYQAADSFGNAGFYDTSNPVVWLAKSHALFAAGEYMSSSYYLEKSLDVIVPPPGEDANLKRVFADAAEFDKRFGQLKQWQGQTNQPMMLFLQGYIEYQSGDLGKACQTLDQAAKFLPNVPAVQKLLAAARQAAPNTMKPAAPDAAKTESSGAAGSAASDSATTPAAAEPQK